MTVDWPFPPKQRFLFDPWRYKGIYGGRGKGGSWGFARAALILGTGSIPAYPDPMRFLCARETQKSIAESVHQLLEDQIGLLGLRSYYEVQKATILGKPRENGSRTEFTFAGLKHNIDNIKSLEGYDVAWVEEAALVSKHSWEKLIPSIRKDKSEIWISWNPELETDETHKRFILNRPPGSKIVEMSWRDNPWFPEVLRIEKDHLRETNYADYLHVWEGQCENSVQGAIYAPEIAEAQKDGRICSVAWDRSRPVDTFWDLGFGDKTAIVFAQSLNGWYQVVDYLEDEGKTISHYVIQLQNRGYLYGTDWVPHDAVDTIIHKHLAGAGNSERSIEQLLRAAGRKVRIAPKLKRTTGINAMRTIFPQCRFDANKCSDLLMALRHYQWGPPTLRGDNRCDPLHNWASHGADAARTMAVSIKQPAAVVKGPTAPRANRVADI